MKKIIVINVGSIYSIPPIKSLLEGLYKQNVEVTLVTTRDGISEEDSLYKKIRICKIDEDYNSDISLILKFIRMIQLRKKIWKYVDNLYDENTLLWIISDATVKSLGPKLFSYNYVLHMYELIGTKYMVPKYKLGNMHLGTYGKNAKRVIVPEYNRAHITKAWWDLDKLPFILENKPFYPEIIEKRNLPINHSIQARKLLEKIGNKKIILYQGILHKERPLEHFISAVDRLGDDYAFVVMSNVANLYANCGSKNYYFIPFICAPYHLEVTSHAYIGVLSYIPTKTSNSILSTVYCAPNKTFEYACFSIPMISNDVPALNYMFEKQKCGICIKNYNIDSICQTIKTISNNYSEYSKNSRYFYDSVDYEKKITSLLNEVYNG